MHYLTIRSGEQGKGRSFSGEILALVEGNCWANAITDPKDRTIRPVYLAVGVSEGAAHAVMANLRLGRVADVCAHDDTEKVPLELLKSAGYEIHFQRHAQGTIIEAYLPHLFLPSAGQSDGDYVSFVLLPRRVDLADQLADIPGVLSHLHRADWIAPPRQYFSTFSNHRPTEVEVLAVAPYAPLFAAMLATRTKCPLIGDERYMVQLLIAFLSCGDAVRAPLGVRGEGWGCAPRAYGAPSYREEGVTHAGFAPGVMMHATAAGVAERLAQETAKYFAALG